MIELYTDRLPPAHAQRRLDEAKDHLGETIFAWIGEFDAVAPFYYRIYSPVIFIEFYHQPGVALRTPAIAAAMRMRWCARRTATITAARCCVSID